jgi:hypothetical protein
MKHTIIIFSLLVFIVACNAMAQSHGPDQYRNLEPPFQRLMFKADNSTELEQESVQASTPQEKQHQFWVKTEKFIASWTAFACEFNKKGTFNVKKAKQASKAFHDLENTEGWPK